MLSTHQTPKHKSSFSIANAGKSVPRFLRNGIAYLESTNLAKSSERHYQYVNERNESTKSTSRYHGWRMGVLMGSCTSALILCFNVAVLVVAATRNSGFKNGFAEPFISSSLGMSQLSSAIHIVINVLSTILLSASNYTMQVLSSPTRAEINREHINGRWFDIGALSLHNLRRISWTRMFMCAVLILSSVPLHLLFVHHLIFQDTEIT